MKRPICITSKLHFRDFILRVAKKSDAIKKELPGKTPGYKKIRPLKHLVLQRVLLSSIMEFCKTPGDVMSIPVEQITGDSTDTAT